MLALIDRFVNQVLRAVGLVPAPEPVLQPVPVPVTIRNLYGEARR